MQRLWIVAVLITMTGLGACKGEGAAGKVPALTAEQAAERTDSIARARQDSINRAQPGYVVDSIFPTEEMLRRFRAAIGGTAVTALNGGSASREALIARFMTALNAADSLELRSMALSVREFADLMYPESQYTKPPYKMDPALVWRTIQNPSGSGFKRLSRRAAGLSLTLVSYRCDPKPLVQGPNSFWQNCELKLRNARGMEETHRFFGTIFERGGQFKFLSYRNEF